MRRSAYPLPYDKPYLKKCLLWLVLMVVGMKLTGGTAFIVAVPLIINFLTKRNPIGLLFVLTMTIAMLVGNANLMPKNSVFGFAQRIAMILAAVMLMMQVASQRGSQLAKPFLLLLPYLLFLGVSSALGWCPLISFMKLFLFLSIYIAYYGMAIFVINSSASDMRKIRSVVLSLACFFIFGSMLLIPFPGISQLSGAAYEEAVKNGANIVSMFTGMTFHSQAMGPICAMLGVVILADMVFGVGRPDKLYLSLLACLPILVWKTSSRTALGSLLVGLALCVYFVMGARNIKASWKTKVLSVVLRIFIVVVAVVVLLPSAREKASGFVLKYSSPDTTISEAGMDEIVMTRRFKWEEGIYNFKRRPFLGNGFQVSEDMKGKKLSMSELSAPVEKSVWISAILEEGGVPGFVLFVVFCLVVIMSLSRQRAYIGLSCFIVFIVVNLGEFTMFSMSGIGGFCWAMIFVGIILDALRKKDALQKRNEFVPDVVSMWNDKPRRGNVDQRRTLFWRGASSP